jgi:hypothetical protein
MGVGASTLGVAARVNLTVGCACGVHPWNFGRLLWQWSRRNRGPVDWGSGGFASLSGWGEAKLLESYACWPKCSSGKVWWSGVDDWGWFLPLRRGHGELRLRGAGHCW